MTAVSGKLVANTNVLLFEALYTFLTSNAALAAASPSQVWISKEYVAGVSFILEGKGLAGTDSIFVGCRVQSNGDIYNLEFRMYTGYSSGLAFENHPGSSKPVYICSFNLAHNYWIVASGRRFILSTKVSTTYHSAYVGFLLPYASPTKYPYPAYLGASSYGNLRWSALSYISHAGKGVAIGTAVGSSCSAYYRTPGGVWFPVRSDNGGVSATTGTNLGVNFVLPLMSPYQGKLALSMRNQMGANFGPAGGYTIFKSILYHPLEKHIVGEMDGYGWISGFGLAAESTTVVDGETWIVYQDVYKTANKDYYAVRQI